MGFASEVLEWFQKRIRFKGVPFRLLLQLDFVYESDRKTSTVLGLILSAVTLAGAEVAVVNGSFETTGPEGIPTGWTPCVIGPMPEWTCDQANAKHGDASCRIVANLPTDAAIQQHVEVEPGAIYLFHGWVKTEDLRADARSDAHGTLAVMSPGGPGEGRRLACGPSLEGTNDWTLVTAPFEGPPEGRVRLMGFLCGWGKGTGTVWFDRLELMPAENLPVYVVVTDEEWADKPSTSMICGNFIESGFGRQVDGLWAELLFNRSFEQVTPLKSPVWGWLDRRPEDDLTTEDWWHSGYEEEPWHVAPGNADAHSSRPRYWDFHHGLQAAGLINRSAAQRAFLAQDGLCLRKNGSYQFSGFLRTGDIAGVDTPTTPVTVGLYEEKDLAKPISEHTFDAVGSAWQEVRAELRNPDADRRATFAVSVPPGASATVDGFSLMPTDHVHGWRRDAVEALKAVNPRIIRFPGGCFASFYHWRDGVGARAQRIPRESEYWGGLEENDVGTAEFVMLCRELDAEPFLCVNVMTGSEADAADWVAYCNAPGNPLRRAHGYEKPFGVTFWELDNETYRKYGAIEYARRCVAFSRAMKAVDPAIELVMVGYWRFRDLLPEMLEVAGEHIDLVTDRGLDEAYLRGVLDVIRAYNAQSRRSIRLCNTEWLALSGDVPVTPDALNRPPRDAELTLQNRQIRWRYAMNAGRQLLTFQRLGGDFAFANFNNMANTWGQNVIECAKEQVWLSATGRVFELLSRSPAARPLKIECQTAHPGIDVQVSWDAERASLVLVILNYRKRETEVSFDLTRLGYRAVHASVATLHAPTPAAHNCATNPNAIERADKEQDLARTLRFTIAVRPHSVNHVLLR